MNEFIEIAKQEFGDRTFSRNEIRELCSRHNITTPRWFLNDEKNRTGRGEYSLKAFLDSSEDVTYSAEVMDTELNLIPEKNPLYVRGSNFNDLNDIIKSHLFYPVYISGLSGNGKTMMVEQACAVNHRKMYRVNITIQTDEDDLLGGFRLVQDSTKWFDGPVIRAMKSGGILLLDEVNLASTKIMCLQPVLEGKGVFLKKINTFVKPAPGFNVIATANTKGQGDDTGKFAGTNVLNEAFLERFCATIEQDYPTVAQETQILKKIFESLDIHDQENFIKVLVLWANQNRLAFKAEGTTEVITTRRLSHIALSYGIFRDQNKALDKCLSRFDERSKESLLELFNALNAKVAEPAQDSPCPFGEETDLGLYEIENIFGTKP